NPLYHPVLNEGKLDELAGKARSKKTSVDPTKAADGSGKKLGRLGAWMRATAAQKKRLEEKWIDADANAYAEEKKKEEQEKKDHRERVEHARSAISKLGKP
ncbi:MAG TPA: hypothetical protein VGY54_04770, partial [Polyangiaceae bacterium]|nr:hypothetical protein [Polyangiaceae bacterium]